MLNHRLAKKPRCLVLFQDHNRGTERKLTKILNPTVHNGRHDSTAIGSQSQRTAASMASSGAASSSSVLIATPRGPRHSRAGHRPFH